MSNRRSIRLKGYDYSKPGVSYFITVCSLNRQPIFGRIVDGKMLLNKYGQIVKTEWLRTFNLRPYFELDEFIIMPNHFHGILHIGLDMPFGMDAAVGLDKACGMNAAGYMDKARCRGTARRAPTVEQFGKPTMGSLPTIVRSFKSAVTKRINESCQTPGNVIWQRNYYEHVIRNEKDLNNAREYIINNPIRWNEDRNNPLNIKMNFRRKFF